jgi:ribosomal protein S16
MRRKAVGCRLKALGQKQNPTLYFIVLADVKASLQAAGVTVFSCYSPQPTAYSPS